MVGNPGQVSECCILNILSCILAFSTNWLIMHVRHAFYVPLFSNSLFNLIRTPTAPWTKDNVGNIFQVVDIINLKHSEKHLPFFRKQKENYFLLFRNHYFTLFHNLDMHEAYWKHLLSLFDRMSLQLGQHQFAMQFRLSFRIDLTQE